MSDLRLDLDEQLGKAIASFWCLRASQAEKESGFGAEKDRDECSAVGVGEYLDGFRDLVANLLEVTGLRCPTIEWRKKTGLSGGPRAADNGDLLVAADGALVAIVEFKSQVGSFEDDSKRCSGEALSNAMDLWTAYEEGAFKLSERPWLGYVMLLEDAPGANRPMLLKEGQFPVSSEYEEASYAERYNHLLTRLVRKRLYDAGCLLMSSREGGSKGEYREPNPELSFHNFVTSLLAKVITVAQKQGRRPAMPPKVEAGPEEG